jgi:hypothetical protein
VGRARGIAFSSDFHTPENSGAANDSVQGRTVDVASGATYPKHCYGYAMLLLIPPSHYETTSFPHQMLVSE